MSDVTTMPVQARERAGKGPARQARIAGQVPAVIYGAKKDPTMITVEERLFVKELHRPGFFASLYDLQVGEKGKKERVLARDVQLHPVTDRPVHIDFLRVSAASTVTIAVPVNFMNEEDCPGLVTGGVLNVVRYEIEVTCRADAMPQQIDVDLTGIEMGDGVHISMVSLPDGVEPTITDRDFTIATIVSPQKSLEKEEAEAAEAEEDAEGEDEVEAGEAEEEASES